MNTKRDFVKADSTNLPKMETYMILQYMGDSTKHNTAEVRGAKALMSSRTSYLDVSIGYVKINRSSAICTVCAKVVPEHRIRDKPYAVTVTINEKDEEIVDAECDGCAAALGGCKHALVVLFWLSKKSSEPACTSVTCYWKKPKLLDARVMPVGSKNIYKNKKVIVLKPKDTNVFDNFQEECRKRKILGPLVTLFENDKNTLDKYNVFDMVLKFTEIESDHSFLNFKRFLDSELTSELKSLLAAKTVNQAASVLWHNIRQGRITACHLHDAAHCNTDGSLVQQILGGYKVPETSAIKRGKTLEHDVLKQLEGIFKSKIEKTGFLLINGLLGASPDGICNDFVIEVKCPSTAKTFKNYIHEQKIQPKFKAQICCQMLAANKKKGLFCVASPDYETNQKLHLLWTGYNRLLTENLVVRATNFWIIYIYFLNYYEVLSCK